MSDVRVRIMGETESIQSFQRGTKLEDVFKYEPSAEMTKDTPVAAIVDGKLRELSYKLKGDATLEPVKVSSVIGFDMYKRSLLLLMFKAFHDVLGDAEYTTHVLYSLGKGYFCTLTSKEVSVNDELLDKTKNRMKELVSENIPIIKKTMQTADAEEYFSRHDLPLKAELLKYRRVSNINVYNIEDHMDYFYGYMLPSTGLLRLFDIVPYEDGFVLIIPDRKTFSINFAYEAPRKLYNVLRQSENWGNMQGIRTVSELNDLIVEGNQNNLILVQEAIMEKQIADIAERILEENKKIVLVAGPSSSGKTTFSRRLSIELKAHGLNPHPVSLDNYFLEREETPKDENGNYDFESLSAMDLKLFNGQMEALLRGETVEMPRFDFTVGQKKYKGDFLTLGEEDVLVAEGIHALNPLMTESLPNDSKFRIYISALTQLNIDEHNRVSTTDGRLLRRIVRDARTRGNDAQKTISMWESVRHGEENNIFPFQEEADVMFNSALIYELAAIKTYAEPLLFKVPTDSPEYYEAKRLLKFLDYFLGMDVTLVPHTSILREFIGGGCFDL